ncbi:MAG: DUF1501 domain-containing protein [Planctomycetes bacterium]|nr:DUF1501 domain-containing protein [Planctomycetota bacterium]
MAFQQAVFRRDFMKLTAAGVIGVSPSGWLLPRAAYAAEGKVGRPRACIMLHMQGGVSQHHTFTVPESKAENSQIDTAVAGVKFCEYFPKLGARMKDICLIRGMSTGNSVHERARILMHTGYNPNGTVAYPSVGNVAACEVGLLDAELPNFVSVYAGSDGLGSGPLHRSVPAYLGPKFAPVPVNDPAKGIENLKTAIGTNEFDETAKLLAEFEGHAQAARPSAAGSTHLANYKKALQLLHSDKMKAFDLDAEPLRTRDAYGKTQFGKSLLLARRLVEVGVPFIEVTLDGWDDHGGAAKNIKRRAEYLDPTISLLIDDLKIRGLFDSTLIVFMSEFGRTPQLADSGYNQTLGAGHYAKAWTTWMAGCGVRGGTVIGKVDAKGGEVIDHPVNAQDFLATICHALKIDCHKEYMSKEGRPMTFLGTKAEPVKEAF